MSAPDAGTERARANPSRGIALKLASVCVFVGMASLIKAASDTVPPGEAVFFRSAFAVPVILGWLIFTGRLRGGLKAVRPLDHLWRAMIGTLAMGFNFTGLGLLPLPEVTAINYAAPLLTVIFAAMFLRETVRAFRMFAVGLGLVGVLIILSPRLGAAADADATEALGAMVVLMGALCAALAQVFVRKLVDTESVSAIVFWFSVNSALLSLVTLPWGWVMPGAATFVMLVMAGALGGLGQVLLTASYRHADASVIAPFEYASMLLALAVGYAVFGEAPTLVMLVGAAIVVVAGILIIWREARLGLERDRQKQSVTPQG